MKTLLSLIFSKVTILYDKYDLSCIKIDMIKKIFSRKTLGTLAVLSVKLVSFF